MNSRYPSVVHRASNFALLKPVFKQNARSVSWIFYYCIHGYPISLDRPQFSIDQGNSEDSQFGDLLPDGTAESPAVGAGQEMLRDRITRVPQEVELPRARDHQTALWFGGLLQLHTGRSRPHLQSDSPDISNNWHIRQIEAKAVRKLQQPSRSQDLVGFLD